MSIPVPENEGDITYFAESDYRNQRRKFGIKREDRSRHMYVIGKTGMGKSTLLQNMAIQDIQNGNGLCFIDPHGETADMLLDFVPEDRIDDVMYFAPFDLEHPISFNVLEDVGPDKRHLVADGLMNAFKKIWVDAWSARMEYLLNNALLALMEYPDSTLLGVNRMFADKRYRVRVVRNITDVSVRAFWEDEFANYDERFMRQATAAIQNKIGQFVSNPLVRNIVGQTSSSFNIRKMMDEKKIMLVNLSKGRVGEDNANLIGSMLITKLYLAAMSRADATRRNIAALPQFYFYVDEFQSFANESFAGILSEARKYKLNLTIAHQYIEQMTEDVKNAVFGNVGTMISFRVGAYDAEVLEREFAPRFFAEDLVNLGFAQIYLKLMINGVSSKPFSARTLPPIEEPDATFRDEIRERSREKYGRPRDEIQAEIDKWHESTYGIIDDEEAWKMAEKQRKQREEEGDTDDDNNGSNGNGKNQKKDKRELVKKYDIGQTVEGPITSVADFGIFVRVEDGLQGLVHVSEFSEDGVENANDVYNSGEHVTTQVIKKEDDKISLSIKALEESDTDSNDGEKEAEEKEEEKNNEGQNEPVQEHEHEEEKEPDEDPKKETGTASLSDLKKKQDKGPSQKNLSKLQNALGKVLAEGDSNLSKDMKESKAEQDSEKKTTSQNGNENKKQSKPKDSEENKSGSDDKTEQSELAKQKPQQTTDSDSTERTETSRKPNKDSKDIPTPDDPDANEIPEDELREMLKVDEEVPEKQED